MSHTYHAYTFTLTHRHLHTSSTFDLYFTLAENCPGRLVVKSVIPWNMKHSGAKPKSPKSDNYVCNFTSSVSDSSLRTDSSRIIFDNLPKLSRRQRTLLQVLALYVIGRTSAFYSGSRGTECLRFPMGKS